MFTAMVVSLLMYTTCSGNQEYILNTAKCKIPNLDPFNEEVQKIMKPQSYFSCNKTELLTFVKKNENNSATVHVNDEIKAQYGTNVSCCYSYVTRNGSEDEPDTGIDISECQPFDRFVVLTHDIVKVKCYNNQTKPKLVYENVHNPIIVKESVKHKIKNSRSPKPFSVLFIVVDSLSRLNFMRTMNQTYSFLLDNFVEMKGYTKVAENTFPNFGALLTGLDLETTNRKCKPRTVGGLDHCPMIWYDYANQGYITAYAEDDSPISTFNYEKKGFLKPPTDYYFKPYIEASETLDIWYNNHMPYCTGPETAGERILNLAQDFATTFKNQPTFGIFWMNTFSHDEVNAPYVMDEKLKKFFEELKKEGILDKSVVALLSDHGIRFGKIKTTRSGWFEERTPINMISVPRRFKRRFRNEYQNLLKNSNKLTSTYDLFETLKHVLVLSGKNYESKGSPSCAKCASLFSNIPSSRSCEDAGIPPEYCTCMGHFEAIEFDSPYVKNVTDRALFMINEMNSADPDSCKSVGLDKILTASLSESLEDNGERYLFVVFKTKPMDITFLATVIFKEVVTPLSTIYMKTIDNNLSLCIQDE